MGFDISCKFSDPIFWEYKKKVISLFPGDFVQWLLKLKILQMLSWVEEIRRKNFA